MRRRKVYSIEPEPTVIHTGPGYYPVTLISIFSPAFLKAGREVYHNPTKRFDLQKGLSLTIRIEFRPFVRPSYVAINIEDIITTAVRRRHILGDGTHINHKPLL